MKSLSTNYKNILRSGSHEFQCIVKIKGTLKASPYSDRYFYISDQEGSITDTTNFSLYNILNSTPAIQEKINVWEHTASIGGFSISLMDDQINGFSEFRDTYNFYNRDIEIYFGDIKLTDLNDFDKQYTGVIGVIDWQDGIITIPVTNSTFKVQKNIPEKLIKNQAITPALSREVFEDVVGTPYGYIYGDYNVETPTVFSPEKTILAKCKLMNSGTTKYWAACENELKSFGDAWWLDKQLGRYVQLSSATYPSYNATYGSYITTNPTPEVFTYWNNDGTVSDTGVVDIWAGSESNLVDEDESTFASPDGVTAIGNLLNAELTVNFDSFDNYEGENLVQTVYAKVDFGTNNPALWTFKINGQDAEGSTGSYGEYGTTSGNVVIELANVSGSSQTPNSTLKIYVCVKKQTYDIVGIEDLWISCEGKPANATIAGEFTGLSTNDLLENPAHIIADIIVNDLGVTTIDSSFDEIAQSELSSWKLAFDWKESIWSKDFLDKVAMSCKSVVRWNENNEPSLLTFKDKYSTDITINGEDLKGLPVCSESSLGNIVNKMKFQYQKIDSYKGLIENEDNRTGTGSQDVYNFQSDNNIETDFINDSDTAVLLSNYFCRNDEKSFWSEIHGTIQVTLPINMQHNYYSGNYIPYSSLIIGDVLIFENMLVNFNGKSFKDRKFLIIETVRTKNNITIMGFEVYDIGVKGEFSNKEFSSGEFFTG